MKDFIQFEQRRVHATLHGSDRDRECFRSFSIFQSLVISQDDNLAEKFRQTIHTLTHPLAPLMVQHDENRQLISGRAILVREDEGKREFLYLEPRPVRRPWESFQSFLALLVLVVISFSGVCVGFALHAVNAYRVQSRIRRLRRIERVVTAS